MPNLKAFREALNESDYTEAFKHVFFFVEATDGTQTLLYLRHHPAAVAAVTKGLPEGTQNIWTGPALHWDDHSLGGRLVTVGKLKSKPVVVSLTFDIIEDQIVCFYYASSPIVDWDKITKWFKEHGMPGRTAENRPNRTNVTNFGDCVRNLLVAKQKKEEAA